jgi:hypothetical protein
MTPSRPQRNYCMASDLRQHGQAGRHAAAEQRERKTAMCMNCGCGEPNERHKPGDITLGDLKKAAQNHNMPVEQAADNIHTAARQARAEGKAS